MITNDATPIPIQFSEIVAESKQDTVSAEIIKAVKTGNWRKSLKPYYQIRDQLSTEQGILLKQQQIVMPKSL